MAKQYVNIVTPEGRLSFPHLFEPFASPEKPEEKYYSFTLLIPKSANIDELKAEVRRVATEAFPKGIPSNFHNPIQDGDAKVEQWGEAYKDHWYIRFKSKLQPAVVDRRKQEILEADDVYSGCYGRANVSFFAYSKSGNNGVAGSFSAVQKMRDGERLGRSVEAAVSAFSDLPDDGSANNGKPSNDLF